MRGAEPAVRPRPRPMTTPQKCVVCRRLRVIKVPKWVFDTVLRVLGCFSFTACFEERCQHLWPGNGCLRGTSRLPPGHSGQLRIQGSAPLPELRSQCLQHCFLGVHKSKIQLAHSAGVRPLYRLLLQAWMWFSPALWC